MLDTFTTLKNTQHETKIDYAVYIDRKHSVVVALDHAALEHFISGEVLDNEESRFAAKNVEQQEHMQNRAHEYLVKMCKAVIAKLVDANSIFVFGPSRSKYILQNELQDSPSMKHIPVRLATTEAMDKEEVIRFAKDKHTTITVGQQVFTAAITNA